MNTRLITLAIATCSLMAINSASAQSTWATTPVGFIKTTINSGTPSGPSLTSISIPFYGTSNGASAYAGAIGSVTSNSLTLSSSAASTAGWTAGQFASSGTPYLVRIKSTSASGGSGLPGTGFFFAITANTSSSVTMDTRGLNFTTLAGANDLFEIVTANTLGSTFGTYLPGTTKPGGSGTWAVGETGVVALQAEATANSADNVLLWGIPVGQTNPTWLTYYFFYNSNLAISATNPIWKLSGSNNNQNATVLYPDEGFFVRRRAQSTVDLVVSGVVPSTTEATELTGQSNSFVATRFPIDMTLKTPLTGAYPSPAVTPPTGLDLHTAPGWQQGSTASNAGDNVLIWGVPPGTTNPPTWNTFYYFFNSNLAASANNPCWKLSGNNANQDAYVVPAGSAVFIRRVSTASGSAAYATHPLPYNLSN